MEVHIAQGEAYPYYTLSDKNYDHTLDLEQDFIAIIHERDRLNNIIKREIKRLIEIKEG